MTKDPTAAAVAADVLAKLRAIKSPAVRLAAIKAVLDLRPALAELRREASWQLLDQGTSATECARLMGVTRRRWYAVMEGGE